MSFDPRLLDKFFNEDMERVFRKLILLDSFLEMFGAFF
jgi:hypothetical protein